MVYSLFPASLIAGPIDRLPRFKADLDQVGQPFQFNFAAEGLWLILIGAFKKFVLADFLARLPLNLAQFPDNTPGAVAEGNRRMADEVMRGLQHLVNGK
ncbi:hypothetical protein TFLX_03768 [Thermoflexales bacterium]|nr:hypothetical protein TFLX_03768 [Thermoflexales bacterium]